MPSSALRGPKLTATLDGAPVSYWQAISIKAGQTLKIGGVKGTGRQRLSCRARRHRRAPLSRQPIDVHARQVRRPRRPRADDRRRAAHRQGFGSTDDIETCRPDLKPCLTHTWEIGVLYGPHGAPDFLRTRIHRDVLFERLGSALQFESDRHPAHRTEAGLGAHRRRRSGASSEQHPRQCLRHRYDRLHRRHARHPRVRTVHRSAVSSVRRRSCRPSFGRWVSFVPATKSASSGCRPADAAARLAKQTAEIASLKSVAAPSFPHTESGAPTIASSAVAMPQATSRASSIVAPATPTCWSNMGRSFSTSRCASASMR